MSSDARTLVDRYTLARHLNVEERTLRDWTARGLLPHYRVGKTIRYSIDEVVQAIRRDVQVRSVDHAQEE